MRLMHTGYAFRGVDTGPREMPSWVEIKKSTLGCRRNLCRSQKTGRVGDQNLSFVNAIFRCDAMTFEGLSKDSPFYRKICKSDSHYVYGRIRLDTLGYRWIRLDTAGCRWIRLDANDTPHDGNVRLTPHGGNFGVDPYDGKAQKYFAQRVKLGLDPHEKIVHKESSLNTRRKT